MSKIVVFGAGGKFGRIFVAEARNRGNEVTAVVRDTAKHADLAGDSAGQALVAGEALDADSVAAVSAGHDVAVSALHPHTPTYLVEADAALLAGLERAGVPRLIVVGGAGSLEVAPGQRLVDTPDFREDWKPAALAHAEALAALRAATTPVDWLYVSPAAFFDAAGPRTGVYQVGGDTLRTDAEGGSHISYADYAVALVDQIQAPTHHNERISLSD